MSNVNEFMRTPSFYLLRMLFKGASAFFVGLTAALIFHVILNYSTFGFVFIGVVFSGLVLKFIAKATMVRVFLFDVAFLFLLVLLKTYITLAPNV